MSKSLILSYKIKKVNDDKYSLRFTCMSEVLREKCYYTEPCFNISSKTYPEIRISSFSVGIFLPGSDRARDNEICYFRKQHLIGIIEALEKFKKSKYVKDLMENMYGF